MGVVTASRHIKASIDDVFSTISDFSQNEKAVPHIVRVELISERRTGVGTKFREFRQMNGREMSNTLEITEYQPPNHVRFVSDEGGTVWDTIFTLTETDGVTELKMQMEDKPYKFIARIMNLMIKGFVQKAIEADMDAIKIYCESNP